MCTHLQSRPDAMFVRYTMIVALFGSACSPPGSGPVDAARSDAATNPGADSAADSTVRVDSGPDTTAAPRVVIDHDPAVTDDVAGRVIAMLPGAAVDDRLQPRIVYPSDGTEM